MSWKQPPSNQSPNPKTGVAPSESHEAWLYAAYPEGRVRCRLCAHHCWIAEGKRGVCQVRLNKKGTLYSLVYGRTISQHVDPIEKKPLYHFYPGTGAYSIATPGCNFRCPWCQNWGISQMPLKGMHHPGRKATPAQIVAKAQSTNCKSIAYTYTEPTIFFEYAYDVALLAHQAGLANVFVTNGYMSMDMLSVFEKTLDGANVDLKSFRNDTYRRYVGAKLQPVLDSLIRMKELGIWVEVTTLVIPEINDDPAELREIAAFIAQELGTETPWHISRFFPTYKLTDHSPTPAQRLQQAREIGLEEGLHYVYVGNLRQGIGEDTQCPNCKTALIRRYGYLILANRMRGDRCPECGAVIAGVELGGLNQ